MECHSAGEEFACNSRDPILIPGSERSPAEGNATDSNILACRVPWTEEPGRLYSPWGHKGLDTTEGLTHHKKE